MNFCNNPTFRAQIAQLLANDLFGINVQLVESWYGEFIQKFCQPNLGPYMITVPPTSLPQSKISSLFAGNYFGHDLPVWMENGVFKEPNGKIIKTLDADTDSFPTKSKRVMIIGQDPMRKCATGVLQIASPWGLHYPSGYNRSHWRFYNYIMTPLLEKDCSVYVTDYYKLYATSCFKNPHDSRHRVSQIGIDYAHILQQEINIFQPTTIIIMSKEQRFDNMVKQAVGNRCSNILEILHVNARFDKGETKGYYQDKLAKVK